MERALPTSGGDTTSADSGVCFSVSLFPVVDRLKVGFCYGLMPIVNTDYIVHIYVLFTD